MSKIIKTLLISSLMASLVACGKTETVIESTEAVVESTEAVVEETVESRYSEDILNQYKFTAKDNTTYTAAELSSYYGDNMLLKYENDSIDLCKLLDVENSRDEIKTELNKLGLEILVDSDTNYELGTADNKIVTVLFNSDTKSATIELNLLNAEKAGKDLKLGSKEIGLKDMRDNIDVVFRTAFNFTSILGDVSDNKMSVWDNNIGKMCGAFGYALAFNEEKETATFKAYGFYK